MTAHHRTAQWAKTVRLNRPRIAASLPALCVDCGWAVTPDQRWQVGHIVSVSLAKRLGWTTEQINTPSNLGASHARCNARAGGKLGAKATHEKKQSAAGKRHKW